MCVTILVFNVCVNDTVQLLNINLLVEELFVMSFDWSCDSNHCCDDCWLSVYYTLPSLFNIK